MRAGRVRHGAHGRAGVRDRGAVTAELALALPAVLLVVAALLVTVGAAAAQLRCAEAARTGARLAAAGETDAAVVAAARRVAGDVEVSVAHTAPWVEVVVTTSADGGWLSGPLRVTASATAWREADVGGAS